MGGVRIAGSRAARTVDTVAGVSGSRGRKRKKRASSGKPRSSGAASAVVPVSWAPEPLAGLPRLLGPPERPAWFDPSIKRVLDGAVGLMPVQGARELEQLTAELLGAELHRAVHEGKGLWLAWWFAELAEAATAQIVEDEEGGALGPAFRLLHGMGLLGTPGAAAQVSATLSRARKCARTETGLPEWLKYAPTVQATGDVVRMRDAYGTRLGVIAGISYADGTNPAAFLFDIDVSGFVKLVEAGVFDDTEQAAAAWRANVGDTADGVRAEHVEDPDELLCLAHCDVGEEHMVGDESCVVMDNWFRAQRRIHDLATALRKRGMPFPPAESLYHELDVTPMVTEFSAWHETRHGGQPDQEATEPLAQEWVEGAIPETWYAVSPLRVEFQLGLIGDWIPDDPVTLGVKALMPEWVSWLGERAGLPAALRERVVAAGRPVSSPQGAR